MRQSQTAVLEKNTTFAGEFQTEPFETAWAGEGRWFVQVIESTGPETTVSVRAQVSPDGLTWCDYDEVDHTVSEGLLTFPVREFGHWLRLSGSVTGSGAEDDAKVRIYLALKS